MKTTLNKKMMTLVLSLALFGSVVPQHKAHALLSIGAGSMAAPVALLGSAVFSLGALGYMGQVLTLGYCQPCRALAGSGLVIGLVILDDSGQGGFEFTPVSREQAQVLGLSTSERDHYNQELSQINAASESIKTDLDQDMQPTVTKGVALWDQYAQTLSPESYNAIKKIAAINVKIASTNK